QHLAREFNPRDYHFLQLLPEPIGHNEHPLQRVLGRRSLRRTHRGGSKCERCEQNRAKEGLSSPHCIPPKCRRVGGASRTWCTIKSLAALMSRVNRDDSAPRVAIPQAAT